MTIEKYLNSRLLELQFHRVSQGEGTLDKVFEFQSTLLSTREFINPLSQEKRNMGARAELVVTHGSVNKLMKQLPADQIKKGRPNFFVVLVDDMVFSLLGAYCVEIKTPNLVAGKARRKRLEKIYQY